MPAGSRCVVLSVIGLLLSQKCASSFLANDDLLFLTFSVAGGI